MQLLEYRAFTHTLQEHLVRDARVAGLVAVGSVAEQDYAPDAWSDHDFFVIVRDGEQEALRTNLSWLPDAERVAFSYRETEHGLKVLYDDGHLLEFAVFGLDELRLASVNRYRVLFDRGGIAERLAERAGETAARRVEPARLFGDLLTHVLVGAGRSLRGEELSGAFFVKGLAVRDLLALLAAAVPAEQRGLLDDLDAARRFDTVHPRLAAEVAALLGTGTVETALGLLELAERELRPLQPQLAWEALGIVRKRVAPA